MTAIDLYAILPLLILSFWATLLVLLDLFIPDTHKNLTALMAAIGLALSMGFSISQFGQQFTAFNGMVTVDGFAVFLSVIFQASGLLGIALAYDYNRRMGIDRSDYYTLLLFSISGMLLIAIASDLIIVFLALELLSIPLYVLAGFARPRLDSEEAALKYFLLGAFAGGFVVYGIALVFGATATTSLSGIVTSVTAGSANLALLAVGAALILIGLGFKVAAVPFHMWTPDVYQGAPSAVTAFMSVGAKAAGFTALLRVFISAFPTLTADLTFVFWMLAALTMILGNLLAIVQSNIKRLLAYSSIAHAGYILMAVVPFGQPQIVDGAVSGALFYLVGYAFTSFGAWAVVIALERNDAQGLDLQDYAGLGRKHPLLAAAMAVFMLSFTGIPPTLGFVGKFYLFRSVLEAGYLSLALIGVVTSLVSAYYYLRVVVIMYMQPGDPEITHETWLQITSTVAALATLGLGIFSAPLLQWASQALLWIY